MCQIHSGLGDISVSGHYQLLQNKKTVSNKLLVQSLWLGTGIKLPTGQYVPEDKSGTAQGANLFQLGTGSLDVQFSGMYDLRLQDAGMNMSMQYRLNGNNKDDYHYGQKCTINTQFYYKWLVQKTMTLAPNLGILFENSAQDTDQGLSVTLSGGYLLAGTLGLEGSEGRFAWGFNWQKPLKQNLAERSMHAGQRFMVHTEFLF